MYKCYILVLLSILSFSNSFAKTSLADAYYYKKNKKLTYAIKKEIKSVVKSFSSYEEYDSHQNSKEFWYLQTIKYRITPYISFKIPFVSFKLAPFVRFIWKRKKPAGTEVSTPY